MTDHATSIETSGHNPYRRTRATCATCLWAGDWHADHRHVRQDLADHHRSRPHVHECQLEYVGAPEKYRATCECGWTAAGAEGTVAIKIDQHGGSLK